MRQGLPQPRFKIAAFQCPFCGVVAAMKWEQLFTIPKSALPQLLPVWGANCDHCGKRSYWDTAGPHCVMTYPAASVGPQPHPMMPTEILADFEEARAVAGRSPRSAAALLRLALQKLLKEQGGTGKDLNTAIGELASRGVPDQVIKAMDVLRVIGNNAVHPGELESSDISDVADTLFAMLNFLVQELIARPSEVAALHASLPPGALDAIKRRDAKQKE